MSFPFERPRRNRKNNAIRSICMENRLCPENLILPLFVVEGKEQKQAIKSMPGVFRLSIDLSVEIAKEAASFGIPAVALFPFIDQKLKDRFARESINPRGLLQRAIQEIKNSIPDLLIISDVAMDPYSSDGHDGLVEDGKILNDATLDILSSMAISQAQAGTDFIAPSDMMDGRIGFIRNALDENGFSEVGILSYSAKYASSLYGPFREALNSAPKKGDKLTYQIHPANSREAIRELALDIEEGSDIVMVKPASIYLDIIKLFAEHSTVPIAAYQVSGEYAMIKAAGKMGWINDDSVMMESLLSIRRAGANVIFSYAALDIARSLT